MKTPTADNSPAWPSLRAEARAYTSLWLLMRGRDADIEPGGLALRSNRGTMVLPAAFGVATVVEIAALHFVLPWPWLRILVAVLSVWSLFAASGYLAVHRVRPHYLTGDHLVLRQSGAIVATMDRSLIASASLTRRFSETNPVEISDRLFLPNMDGTNVDIFLRQPTTIRLPAVLARHRRTASVQRISMYVDDPAALATALRNGTQSVA